MTALEECYAELRRQAEVLAYCEAMVMFVRHLRELERREEETDERRIRRG